MAGGRPSSYDPGFCEVVKDLGNQGHSRTAIAAELGVVRQTLVNWEGEHPEFLVAMEQARVYEQRWWEDQAKKHMYLDHQGGSFNANLWSRSMAARFPEQYRENKTVAVTGADGGAIKLEDASPMETARRVAFLLRQGLESEDTGDTE